MCFQNTAELWGSVREGRRGLSRGAAGDAPATTAAHLPSTVRASLFRPAAELRGCGGAQGRGEPVRSRKTQK